MEGLVLGLDLCDAYTQLVCDRGEKTWTLPTVICRKKKEELWLVGEPAYASALAGDGVMVDKLVKLVTKDGTSTIGGIRYGGAQLMVQFLIQVLTLAKEEYGTEAISQLVFSVPKIEARLLKCLTSCGDYLGVEEKDLTGPGLVKLVEQLVVVPGRLKELGENAKKLAKPRAVEEIAAQLLALAGEGKEK